MRIKMSVFKKIVCKYLYVFLILNSTFLSAQKLPTTEYQVKAAFIFNFTQFVEWPPDSIPASTSPIIIGILGDNPFGSYLEEIVKGENMNGHPLLVQYYKNMKDVKNCQILFINVQEIEKMEDSMAIFKKRHILTISNDGENVRQEEVIRFYVKNNKIQFQINTEACKESNLVISSKMLKLAKIYIPQ